MRARTRILGVATGVVLTLAAAGPAAGTEPRAAGQTSTIRPHVMVIVLENHPYRQIIGNSNAPYLNRLASRYGLATHYRAVTHPSLPNYLAMTGGATFGIKTDCTTCLIRRSNVADQLGRAGFRWKAYAQSMPSPCYRGAWSGPYAKK